MASTWLLTPTTNRDCLERMAEDPPVPDPSNEILAMSKLAELLGSLSDEQRLRVLKWAADFYQMPSATPSQNTEVSTTLGGGSPSGASSETFAKLLETADPKSGSIRVLCAAYWLHINGAEQVDGASVNRLLKEHGVDVPNVTTAFSTLIGKKPRLAMQAGRKGKAQKLYRLTTEGQREVRRLISQQEVGE